MQIRRIIRDTADTSMGSTYDLNVIFFTEDISLHER